MNLYEDETLEQKLDELSDQVGLLVLDLLLAGVYKARGQAQIFPEFTEARTQPRNDCRPF